MGEDGPVGDEVGVDARMGLDVGVVGTEQGPGELGRPRLDGVDVAAPGVVAMSRHALGVLVGQPVAHCQQHGGGREVLTGDQLEVGSLVGQLGQDRVGHFGGDTGDDVERGSEGDRLGRGGRGGSGSGLDAESREVSIEERADGHGPPPGRAAHRRPQVLAAQAFGPMIGPLPGGRFHLATPVTTRGGR